MRSIGNCAIEMPLVFVLLSRSADSTNSDYFAVPMGVLVETIYGNNQKTTLLPGGVPASAPTHPLAMAMLDSLTVHAKMRSGQILTAMKHLFFTTY